jgi:hypothetical protein
MRERAEAVPSGSLIWTRISAVRPDPGATEGSPARPTLSELRRRANPGTGPFFAALRGRGLPDASLDQPCHHYQHCCQPQNSRCERHFRVGRHLCRKLDHLTSPAASTLSLSTAHRLQQMFVQRDTTTRLFVDHDAKLMLIHVK